MIPGRRVALAAATLHADHLLVEADGGGVLHGLIGERSDQIFGQDLGKSGHVVDVFLGIQRGQLAAELGQRVDDLGLHLPHARVEGPEQARGSAADDRQIVDVVVRRARLCHR